jgi:hypothetical protein
MTLFPVCCLTLAVVSGVALAQDSATVNIRKAVATKGHRPTRHNVRPFAIYFVKQPQNQWDMCGSQMPAG